MKNIVIKALKREHTGKKDAKILRRKDQIPCVLYGFDETVHFSTDVRSFNNLVYTPEVYIINLDLEGKQYKMALKEVQYHPVSDKIIHADFVKLYDDRKAVMTIPLRTVGAPIGLVDGGQLIVKMRWIKVKGFFDKLPDHLEINIENLRIGGSVKVKDIDFPGIELLEPPNAVIARVKAPRELIEIEAPVEVAAEALAEGAEPPKEGEEPEPGETPVKKEEAPYKSDKKEKGK